MSNYKNFLFDKVDKIKQNIISYGGNLELFSVNDDIFNGLKNDLRDYQRKGFENLILINNKDNQNILERDLKKSQNDISKHSLFHMATGSGKTLMMAGSIIYMAALGYRKFIFTTNQSNLIEKTKLNLIKSYNSDKCEFKDNYVIVNGQRLKIKEVDTFSKYSNDIEIIITTIHDLHNKTNTAKENAVNENDFKDNDIIILADEAHHFQAKTKMEKKEKETENAWEKTINKILYINPKNKLIEFTATMDFNNDKIKKKYKDKIIFNYDLKNFRRDGYSKEISLITRSDKDERIIESVLVNQYRYVVAQKNNIPITPKMLFKSKGTISNLEKELDYIINLIKKINKESILGIIKNSKNSEIRLLKEYLDKENVDIFISSLKKSFNKSSFILIHSSDKDKIPKLKILNNLDDNTEVRAVIAIDMLNEGWDVKSLYDIIKLDDDNTKGKTTTTTSEAQLIGRGARICPYSFKKSNGESVNIYKRKFDNDVENELRVLEDMNFYSSNDNDYIRRIKEDLIESGLMDSEEKERVVVSVKKSSNLNNFAKKIINYYVFSNHYKEKYRGKKIKEIDDIKVSIKKQFESSEYNAISEDENIKIDNKYIYNIKEMFNDDYKFIFSAAINYFSYFDINNMKEFFNIVSKEELLGNIFDLGDSVSISIDKNKDNLKYSEVFAIAKDILTNLEKELKKKSKIKVGGSFDKKSVVKDVFRDYLKAKPNVIDFNSDINGYEIKNKGLFYYDKISYDSQDELHLIRLFDEHLDPEKFLVIRNDIGFKIYNTQSQSDESTNSGFEPDFIVLKDSGSVICQYFIEVKGKDRADSPDQRWKRELLLSLKGDEKMVDNINYRLYGLDFFINNNITPSEEKRYFEGLLSNLKI